MRVYDVFISGELRLAQLYGLYRTVFRIRSKRHIILELMLDEDQSSMVWKLKRFIQRLCFSYVDCIFVSASSEVTKYSQRFNFPQRMFEFLPFHTNVIEPKMLPVTGNYILSAGKTGRDYATLAKAVDGIDIKVVVVSDRYHVDGIHFPDNVEVYCDIAYQQYMELLRGCRLVVVPLKKLVKSTGQVVFLEAMALGRTVIATETTGTTDYIADNVTGILVPPNDAYELRRAVERYLQDPASYLKLAKSAFQQVIEKHTFTAYTTKVLTKAKELVAEKKT